MDKPVILQTKNLVHTYKTGVTALKGVSLDVYQNDVLSIVGQNGSGKTTLVRHFNGLLRPTHGQVLIEGEDTAKMSISSMSQRVGYVFQNPNHQIFCVTVRDELEVGPKNYGFTPEKIRESVEWVSELMHLGDSLKTHPLSLDYTSKKIVTIASVLVFRPEVLILDEPTGGLDQAGREMLTKIIDLMHREGHTVIMISHDMDYVAENSKRVVVMSGGEIIRDDVPHKVFDNAEILKQAQIEPPQITQLDQAIAPKRHPSLSVAEFIHKYRQV